jgi:large subunit ribosomal protein L1
MAKSKYKVAVMDELPTEEQLAMEKMEKASLRKHLEESEMTSTSTSEDTEVQTTTEETASEAPVEEVAAPVKPTKAVGFRSNRYKQAKSHIDRTKVYGLVEALKLLKETATAKFDETVEIHLITKEILSSVEVAYPHSTGKVARVAVFNDDIIAALDKGIIEFDVLVASPAQMKNLTKYARLLGPKGLMPNPKNGTLVADPEKRAKDLASGKTAVKSEKKAPLIHTTVGKMSLGSEKLAENIQALLNACGQGKILKAVVTTTMSPGIKISVS